MKMAYIILVLAVLCMVSVMVIVILVRCLRKAQEQNKALTGAMEQAAEELRRVKGFIDKTNMVAEEANGKRRELSQTSDGGLADRANALFGGVRGRQGGGDVGA